MTTPHALQYNGYYDERPFYDGSPEALKTDFEKMTDLKKGRWLETDRWLLATYEVVNVKADFVGDNRAVYVDAESSASTIKNVRLAMHFDGPRWEEKLASLSKTDTIVVVGLIVDVNTKGNGTVLLNDCELI